MHDLTYNKEILISYVVISFIFPQSRKQNKTDRQPHYEPAHLKNGIEDFAILKPVL